MAEIPGSILDSTKKVLGLDSGYTAFDLDVIMHINSAFATLHQLGVGPEEPLEIEDNTVLWDAFTGGNKKINSAKTLTYLMVRLWFDPPTTSFDLNAKQEQIKELQWRLNVASEEILAVQNGGFVSAGIFMWTLLDENVFPDEAKIGDYGIFPATGHVWRNDG